LATRVFELAREIGVTSKVILNKLHAEGLDIKNHMSTVSAGLEATIREWFSEEAAGTAVETSDHVDLDKAREEAKRQRRKRKTKAGKAQGEPEEDQQPEQAAPAAETQAEQEAQGEPAPAAAAVETAEDEAPAVEPDAPAAAEAQAEAEMAEPEAPGSAPVAAEPEPQAEPSETPAQPQAPAEAPKVAAEAETEPQAPEKPAEPEEQQPQPQGDEIKPAGPQVVPKPAALQGPKVVRVEKPDYVPPKPARSRPPRSGGRSRQAAPPPPPTHRRGRGGSGGGSGGGTDKERRPSRRSPRRRGGRSADSGEKLKEWRNQDLLEREQRLAAAGAGLRRHRASVGSGRRGKSGPNVKSGPVEIEEPITVKSLSAAAGLKTAAIIKKLMANGILATINQSLTLEQAEMVCMDYEIELKVKQDKTAEQLIVEELESREPEVQESRAPVVTFLGHVDHGKTSLLDAIRKTEVTEGEAGGITQHIGAYRYDRGDSHVVFLDTPGHEAFTAMRARGANMTDVVVLVVAADDGVMPQTAEAINHAKAAGVPIVVALNKVDVPNANINRALGQLAEHELQPREWGGETEVIHTSAIQGDGIEDLVETLSLEAELLELKADPTAPATGFVIESEMDPGKGIVARLLIRDGSAKVGDIILAGQGYGRIRLMVDSRGKNIEQAGPATPIEIAGLDEMPEAGDRFCVVEDLDLARSAAEERRQRARNKELAMAAKPTTLESVFSQIEAGQRNEVALIIKADVQGSIEALVNSLEKLGTDEIQVNILHAAVGGITAGDVTLADASDAVIIGFNTVPDSGARQLADAKGVDIRNYRVIYNVIDDVRKALEEGLAPEIREETLGRAQVRQTFKVSRFGTIAGSYVVDGVVNRNAKVRIIRDNIVIEDERSLDSLKRFKEDAREVRAGLECGIKVAGYDDIKEGDILEFYKEVEVARTL
jgi:translation initiation factor IF-2